MNLRDWEKDDFFLDQLSQGIDPSQGQDPLAAALLGLRTEIESEIPAAPELADADHNVVPLHSGGGRSRHCLSRADARRSRRWAGQWFRRWPTIRLGKCTGGGGSSHRVVCRRQCERLSRHSEFAAVGRAPIVV